MIQSDSNQIGVKAYNLAYLKKNYPDFVPRFRIINLHKVFINWPTQLSYLNANANNYLKEDSSLSLYEQQLNKILSKLYFNDAYIQKQVDMFIDQNFNKVSFRTSSVYEDLDQDSFAGLYSTFLDQSITVSTIKTQIPACTKSLFSPKVLQYFQKKKFNKISQTGSIIIQEMFYGTHSGVLFTENGWNQMEVAYTHSWKNNTVRGDVAHKFIIQKSNSQINEQIPYRLPKTITDILNISLSLEKKISKPLDIEWAINNQEARLFQFRPITSFNLNYSIAWDNTNIAESYPGITLPLTYTFIKRLYANVYPQFLILLGKSHAELSKNNKVFQNMLGYLSGRIYYNIDNWYKLISYLPGYSYNKDFFEAMLMPAKKLPDTKIPRIKKSFLNQCKFYYYTCRFVILLLLTDYLSKKFTKTYIKKYNLYKNILWSKLTAVEILSIFNTIESEMLEQWAVPILNDFRTMVFHGILRKVFFPKKNDRNYITLLSGISDTTGLEPLRELQKLAKEVNKLTKIYQGNDKKLVYDLEYDKNYQNLREKITVFTLKYGSRSPDELKLENPRINENFHEFIEFIVATAKGYSPHSEFTKRVERKSTHSLIRQSSPFKRIFLKITFDFVLSQTKKGISKRERFRFYRAQVYGIARKAYLALGERFKATKLLANTNDIFYLTTQEIEDIILGHSLETSFQKKVKERKKLFKKNTTIKSARRIEAYGLIPSITVTQNTSTKNKTEKKLAGLGVSSGIFRGKVVVVKKFDPHADVKGKVLVTEHTDPGWALLFINASALIVERGNALSHASIVSREMGIPAVVAVEDVCNKLEHIDQVIVNGNTGEITLL